MIAKFHSGCLNLHLVTAWFSRSLILHRVAEFLRSSLQTLPDRLPDPFRVFFYGSLLCFSSLVTFTALRTAAGLRYFFITLHEEFKLYSEGGVLVCIWWCSALLPIWESVCQVSQQRLTSLVFMLLSLGGSLQNPHPKQWRCTPCILRSKAATWTFEIHLRGMFVCSPRFTSSFVQLLLSEWFRDFFCNLVCSPILFHDSSNCSKCRLSTFTGHSCLFVITVAVFSPYFLTLYSPKLTGRWCIIAVSYHIVTCPPPVLTVHTFDLSNLWSPGEHRFICHL